MKQQSDISKKANSFGAFLQIAQSIQPESAISETGLIAEFLNEALNEEAAERAETSPGNEPAIPEADEQTIDLLHIVAKHEAITVSELMRKTPLNFLEFARRMNNLTEIGLLELGPAPDNPQIEQVRLSALGRQVLDNTAP